MRALLLLCMLSPLQLHAASATISVGVEFIAVSEDTGKPSTMEEPHIGGDELFIIVEDDDDTETVTYIFI